MRRLLVGLFVIAAASSWYVPTAAAHSGFHDATRLSSIDFYGIRADIEAQQIDGIGHSGSCPNQTYVEATLYMSDGADQAHSGITETCELVNDQRRVHTRTAGGSFSYHQVATNGMWTIRLTYNGTAVVASAKPVGGTFQTNQTFAATDCPCAANYQGEMNDSDMTHPTWSGAIEFRNIDVQKTQGGSWVPYNPTNVPGSTVDQDGTPIELCNVVSWTSANLRDNDNNCP